MMILTDISISLVIDREYYANNFEIYSLKIKGKLIFIFNKINEKNIYPYECKNSNEKIRFKNKYGSSDEANNR